jgi:hypothetical protein
MVSTVTELRRGAVRRARRLFRLLGSLHVRRASFTSEANLAVVHLARLPGLRETFVLQILRLVRSLGYAPVIYLDGIGSLLQLSRFSESVMSDYRPILTTVLPRYTDQCLLVCDQENEFTNANVKKWKGALNLEFDLSRRKDELIDPLYVPFPDRSIGWLSHEIKKNRNQRKKIRVLFSGAYLGYRGNGIQLHLGKMEREEIIGVFRNFPRTRVIESKIDLDALLSDKPGDDPYCCFVDTEKFRIPQEQWFSVLGQAQVFLCPPGIIHPFCHNAVEAMAVGTIPLINYHEWFHPKLSPEVNCLTFSNAAELMARLEWLMEADDRSLAAISSRAQAYYDEHLDPDSFVRDVKERLGTPSQAPRIDLVMTTEIVDFFPNLKADSLAFG